TAERGRARARRRHGFAAPARRRTRSRVAPRFTALLDRRNQPDETRWERGLDLLHVLVAFRPFEREAERCFRAVVRALIRGALFGRKRQRGAAGAAFAVAVDRERVRARRFGGHALRERGQQRRRRNRATRERVGDRR